MDLAFISSASLCQEGSSIFYPTVYKKLTAEFLVALWEFCDIPSTWLLVLVFNGHNLYSMLLIADSHSVS